MLSGPPPTLATKIWWKDPENRWKGAKWRKSISPTQKRTNMKWGFRICFMWSWRTISCPKWNRKANRQYRKNAQTLNFRRNLRPLKRLNFKNFTSVSIPIDKKNYLTSFENLYQEPTDIFARQIFDYFETVLVFSAVFFSEVFSASFPNMQNFMIDFS